MTPNSSWVPDESFQTLFAERCWLQGAILGAATYGIVFCLSFVSLYELLRSPNRPEFKERLPLLVYIAVSLLLNTFFLVSNAAFTQMAFVDDRNFPGGPNALEINRFSIPIDNLGNISFILSIWWSDALVVWRFKVIYQSSRAPTWLVILFPCLMFACSVALGIALMVQVSTTSFYVTRGVNFTLPYLSVSLILNIILTIAIVLRLLIFRCRVSTVLGPMYGKYYTSMAAMAIESSALYSIVSITFLVLFGIGNPVSHVFIQSLNQFQTISTCLIMFRIARGRAWTEETATCMIANGYLEPMKFAGSPPVVDGSLRDTENAGGGERLSRDEERAPVDVGVLEEGSFV